MKKISNSLFVATLAIISFSSCSSDDSTHPPTPEPQPTNLLLGKWDMNKMDMKLVMDGNILVDETDVDTKSTGIIVQYDFKSDNKVDYYIFTPANAQQAEQEQSGTGTYTRNGDELTLTLGTPTPYTIKLLTSTDLHLNLYDSDNVNGAETTIDMTQKFTKM